MVPECSLLTYLLTPWCRVLLEKLTGLQLVKKFPAFYGTQMFITYLLTPWCRVLLEKLTALQLVKKFPAFHGTRRFITALTSVRHLSLSWASPIQSIYPHPTSWRSILILSTHLHLGHWSTTKWTKYMCFLTVCVCVQNCNIMRFFSYRSIMD